MVTTLLTLSALAGLFGAAEGQVFGFGACPNPPVQENFDVTKFLGVWYEIEKIPALFEMGSCTLANYTLLENGNIEMIHKEISKDGKEHQAESVATQPNPTEPAKMEVKYNKLTSSPYWVLATDYDNYAIVYSCRRNVVLTYRYYVWILARNPSLPPETMTYLHTILASNDIQIDKMKSTDQEKCPEHR